MHDFENKDFLLIRNELHKDFYETKNNCHDIQDSTLIGYPYGQNPHRIHIIIAKLSPYYGE